MAQKSASSRSVPYLSNILSSVYAPEETRMVRGSCALSSVNLPSKLTLADRLRMAYVELCRQRGVSSEWQPEVLLATVVYLHTGNINPEAYVRSQFVAEYPHVPQPSFMVSDRALDNHMGVVRRDHLIGAQYAQQRLMYRALNKKLHEDAALCSTYRGSVEEYPTFLLQHRDVLSPYFLLEHSFYRGLLLGSNLLKPDRVAAKLAIDRVGEIGLRVVRSLAGKAIHTNGIEAWVR